MRCEDVHAVAADLALDELTGAERAAALAHLASCAGCRGEVSELAAVADSLLLLAPAVEPPAGFESRVAARLAPPPSRFRRPRLVVAAAAAAVAAVAGGVVGFAVGEGDGGGRALPVAAALVDARGGGAGSIVLAEGPDRMTCVFEGEAFGGGYAVEVVDADGTVVDVGEFSFEGVPWSWTVRLPVDAADVREVRVLDEDGVLRATAEVDV